MAETRTLTCDHCNADLRFTNYASEYYLTLSPCPKSHAGGIMYGMALPAPLDAPRHFCKLRCLEVWLDKIREEELIRSRSGRAPEPTLEKALRDDNV